MSFCQVRGERPRWVLMVPQQDEEGPPLYRKSDPDHPETRAVEEILSQDYIRSMLKVGWAYQNFLARRGENPHPPYFALRASDPRPAAGFRLLDDKGVVRSMPRTFYVQLFTGAEREPVPRAEVESILLHEYGHVLLFQLAGLQALSEMPRPYTRMHLCRTATDYTNALNEGWGIHFECITRDLSPSEEVRSIGDFDPRPWSHFLTEEERRARLNGVPANAFICEPLDAAKLSSATGPVTDRLVYQATCGVADPAKLRPPQGMLSCEGVVAALFYRIVRDPHIRQSRASSEFYSQFLAPRAKVTDAGSVFSPRENAYLKLGAALHSALREDQSADLPPTLALIYRYGEMFGADRRRIYRLFLETTALVTICRQAPSLYRKMHYQGSRGLAESLRKTGEEWEDLRQHALKQALQSTDPLQALAPRLGRQLWLQNDELMVPSAYWLREANQPLTMNVNAAPAQDLQSVEGLDGQMAARIMQRREALGHFTCIEHLQKEAHLPREVTGRLKQMRRSFSRAPARYLMR